MTTKLGWWQIPGKTKQSPKSSWNPQVGLLSLPPQCRLTGLTAALRAAETGPFILGNNLLGTPALRQMPFFFFWFGVFGLCRALHTICQQLYSSSCSRNYQDVTLVSHRFNAICKAGEGCQGSFWSSLTAAQQNYNWENSSCNLIHLEQFQWHLRVHRAVTGGWR